MAKNTVKKQQKTSVDKKEQAKAVKAAKAEFQELEAMLIERFSDEEFFEYQRLSEEMLPRMRMFCIFYAHGDSGAEAARRAGYSPDSARFTASRLLTNANVRAFQTLLRTGFESPEIAKIPEVMKRYTRILRREDTDSIPITVKEKKSSYDKNGKKRTTEKETVQIVEVPARLKDVIRAGDSIMKRWGAFKTDITVSGNISGNVQMSHAQNLIATLATSMSLDDMAVTLKSANEKLGVEDEAD